MIHARKQDVCSNYIGKRVAVAMRHVVVQDAAIDWLSALACRVRSKFAAQADALDFLTVCILPNLFDLSCQHVAARVRDGFEPLEDAIERVYQERRQAPNHRVVNIYILCVYDLFRPSKLCVC